MKTFLVEAENEYGQSYTGSFNLVDDSLEMAERLHRGGYSVTVYKDDKIYCEYEQ